MNDPLTRNAVAGSAGPALNDPVTAPNSGGVPNAGGQINPPLPSQLRTTLAAPGDSPPLPQVHEDLLNDGIADQVSRRSHRRPVVFGALAILVIFTLCLASIVGVLGYTFTRALHPENVAKHAAAELHEEIKKAAASPTDKDKVIPSDTTDKSGKGSSPEKPKAPKEAATVKESVPVKIEAKIYGEVRDSMVPLVALVSILTVAIVVILGTMLKAAFAPHPNGNSDLRDNDNASPVPLLEALKGLIESVKAAWK